MTFLISILLHHHYQQISVPFSGKLLCVESFVSGKVLSFGPVSPVSQLLRSRIYEHF
jgi:hypothetical protein